MSEKGRFEAAERRARQAVSVVFMAVCLSGMPAQAAVADLVPAEPVSVAPALGTEGRRQADALAWFANGLFEEESEGPEKALESYRKSLALDPGNVPLAIKVSYDYLRRGETAEAISVLKDAAKAAPKDTTPCLALSTIYLRHLQKPDLAIKYAQQAMDIAPKTFAPYEALLEVYQTQGQATRADQLLQKAAKSKSEDPEFWLSLAEFSGRVFLRDSGATVSDADLKKVSGFLDKAAEYGKENPEVLSRVGDIHVLARQIERAVPFYEQVAVLKSTYPQIREKLAAAYVETGQNEKAIAKLEEIVKLNPLSLPAYDQLTALYLKTNDQEKALSSARQALVMDPQTKERHLQIIDLLFKLRKFEQAADALAEARKRFPKTGLLTYYHGIALSEVKKHEEAMRAFEEALVEAANSQPDLLDGDFYFSYGAASEQAGQYVKAADLFRKSIELDPSNAARSYNYLGYMWVERNENLEEAGQLIRRALELEPGNGAYLDSLGWLYFKQGKYQEALVELQRAAEALPEPDAVVYEHIGDACDKLGKKAEAVLYWQKALQLDNDNKTLAGKLDKAAEKVAQKPRTKETATPQTQDQ